jgi:hypothetical protein
MSGRIGKYTYKNEAVLNEFLSKVIKALAKRKASKVVKQLKRDPNLKKKLDAAEKTLRQLDVDRKKDPEMDRLLTSLGM